MSQEKIKSPQIIIYVTANIEQKEEKPVRSVEPYEYCKVPTSREDAIKMFFGSLILFMALGSFIALLIMM